MRKRASFLLLISIVIAGSCFECKKKNVTISQVSLLPPLTTTGRNTFGCLFNGQAMIPKRPFGDIVPYLTAIYQNHYSSDLVHGNTFAIDGDDKTDVCHFKTVGFSLDSIHLELATYKLNTARIAKGQSGSIQLLNACGGNGAIEYATTSIVTGEVTIVFLDEINQVASGTFWFDAIPSIGNLTDTIHIREGRFDMHYTR